MILTLEHVKQSALKAYEAGKLTAQHPIPSNRQCVYKHGEYNCAIGAALDHDTLEQIFDREINTCTSVDSLADADIGLEFLNQAEQNAILKIQEAHDAWATMAAYFADPNHDRVIEARDKLLGLLK